MTRFDVLVLFGSTSDASVYEPLCALLREQGWRVDFEVISAHRNPDRLEERLGEADFDSVIAGAGISAHLPGVVASKVMVPVFGIPVGSQFQGLDSVMSIQMMPRGVPVLSCGPTTWHLFVPFLTVMRQRQLDWQGALDVVIAEELVESAHFEKEWARLCDKAEERGVDLNLRHHARSGQPTIQFVTSEDEISGLPLVVHVPLLTGADRGTIEAGVKCFKWTTQSGLWVGVNNSINALHFFERCFAATRLPPVYHVGSVKNLLGTPDSEKLIFAYSNRYSIFDWGEMPDQIPSKGYCLASMAWMFFDAFGTAEKWQGWNVNGVDSAVLAELQQDGLAHHMVGLVDRNGQDVGLDTQTTLLKVSRVNVIKPGLTDGVYDYAAYAERPVDALVPLEIIFRFGVPNGSSLMKRVGNEEYLAELGLSTKPNFGDLFAEPVIEYSTKLETTDRYIPKAEACTVAGLTDGEMHRLTEVVRIVAHRLNEVFAAAGLLLWDGKLEFAFADKDESGNRRFKLVDSIGPDELRLTYNGVQLSKECLRQPYRGTAWHEATQQAKALAKERGQTDWKSICTAELQSAPAPLSAEYLGQISGMYQALTNAVSESLYDQRVFADAPSLDSVATSLES